ncbi:cannabinoid receptor 1-like [Limulus polyphemus]|uniref:Cannabinoid receptor 1-like n=1 Tax=Limulus polyphemus TaxID=6850 RepID=A0ABM1T1V7_LIMPO|nr:cannabinoid receptor 1-like [Limulus polyphemus]
MERLNCSSGPQNFQNQETFIILAVSMTTTAFFLNFLQVTVIIHQKLYKSSKNIVLLNFSICGQLTSAIDLWYIYTAMKWTKSDEVDPLDDLYLCLLLPSGLLLLSFFTFWGLYVARVIQQYIVVLKHRCFTNFHHEISVTMALIASSWTEGIVLALLPLIGWNSWNGLCHVPTVWESSFSLTFGLLYILHLLVITAMFVDMLVLNLKKRRTIQPYPNENTVSFNDISIQYQHPPTLYSRENFTLLLEVIIFILFTLPFLIYFVYLHIHPISDPCLIFPKHHITNMWMSMLLILFAAVIPIFHMCSQRDLTRSYIAFIQSLVQNSASTQTQETEENQHQMH